MRLNLPIMDQLTNCKRILIAGMGGGLDVFCGLPLYFELRDRGYTVYLGNLSFSETALRRLKDARRLAANLYGVCAYHTGRFPSFPEIHLARWMRDVRAEDITIWCFINAGLGSLLEGYRALVRELSVDAIILVDGGMDSLSRGDEPEMGSVLEDALSLAAVRELQEVPVRLTCCSGFGIEREVSHAHILENIAALTADRAFLGACSLAPQMHAFQQYEQALLYVQRQRFQQCSVINSSIVSAARGEYGDFHLTERTAGTKLHISPLMSILWFFELAGVAERNLFLPALLHTATRPEAMAALYTIRSRAQLRPNRRVEIS